MTLERVRLPVYPSHEEAKCYKCGSGLDHWYDTKGPDGEGRYVGICYMCGIVLDYPTGPHWTHYDLRGAEDEVA
jgi:hypothetical protein